MKTDEEYKDTQLTNIKKNKENPKKRKKTRNVIL